MREYYVYILRCRDGSYYTGVTNDYVLRFSQHQEGLDPSCYTFARRPLQLVYVAAFGDVNEAIAWEKQVKRWSRRKKEALIGRQWSVLPKLAQCRNVTKYLSAIDMRVVRYSTRRRVHVILSPVEG